MSVSASPARALRRVLPFRSVVSTIPWLAYAAVSLLACFQLAAFLAGVLAVLAAFCFSELNALYPSAAAIRQYIRAAFGERASLTIAFGYVWLEVPRLKAVAAVKRQARGPRRPAGVQAEVTMPGQE